MMMCWPQCSLKLAAQKSNDLPIDEDIMLCIDPTTTEVVAAEIRRYLAGVVRDRPQFSKFITDLGVHTNGE